MYDAYRQVDASSPFYTYGLHFFMIAEQKEHHIFRLINRLELGRREKRRSRNGAPLDEREL
jgi:c-di-GMP-binding flagellar brake protein YcgR